MLDTIKVFIQKHPQASSNICMGCGLMMLIATVATTSAVLGTITLLAALGFASAAFFLLARHEIK